MTNDPFEGDTATAVGYQAVGRKPRTLIEEGFHAAGALRTFSPRTATASSPASATYTSLRDSSMAMAFGEEPLASPWNRCTLSWFTSVGTSPLRSRMLTESSLSLATKAK